MTKSDSGNTNDQSIRAQAATWLVRLQEEWNDADLLAFEAWLTEDPEHFEALEKVASAWGAMDLLGAHPEMLRRRRDALDYMHREDVGTARETPGVPTGSAISRRVVLGGAAAAALLLMAGGALVTLADRAHSERYETGFGERRIVTLPDGSRLSLDEGTQVDVAYSRERRYLELRSGQAHFNVAHDAARPFEVMAQDRIVRAVGTEFNVDLMTSSLVVTLIEGRLLVSPGDGVSGSAEGDSDGDSRPIAMTAGDQLTVTANDTIQVNHGVDAANEIAWEKGQIIFVDEPLVSAVQRLNGYARRTLVLTDAETEGIRVSGVFDIDDVPAFVEAVTAYLPVESKEDSSGRILLSARR